MGISRKDALSTTTQYLGTKGEILLQTKAYETALGENVTVMIAPHTQKALGSKVVSTNGETTTVTLYDGAKAGRSI